MSLKYPIKSTLIVGNHLPTVMTSQILLTDCYIKLYVLPKKYSNNPSFSSDFKQLTALTDKP